MVASHAISVRFMGAIGISKHAPLMIISGVYFRSSYFRVYTKIVNVLNE